MARNTSITLGEHFEDFIAGNLKEGALAQPAKL